MILDAAVPSIGDSISSNGLIIAIGIIVVLFALGGIIFMRVRKGDKKKKIKSLIVVLICLFVVNVKADMGPPIVASHEAMVTNKNGAICYDNGKKTDKVIPYKTVVRVSDDIDGSYMYVSYGDYDGCNVKYSDVSAVTQSFNLDSDGVDKITPTRAIILAKSGLNMRKGPAVTYSKIMTIPQNAIVKITHKAGTYWYYCEYNGKSGWITGMDGYFGYDGKEVLINYEPVKIYSTIDKKAVIGKIPANTEISEYINLVSRADFEISHYVIYNGTKGYVEQMLYKTDGTGKIKLLKNFDVKTEVGELIKKLTPQELEYNMVSSGGSFYLTEKKVLAPIPKDYYEYVKEAKLSTKTKGYLGEGLFGEAKEENTPTPEPTNEEKKEDNKEANKTGMSTRDIIIISLLGGIFLALTAIVIIKLVNSKKKTVVTQVEEKEVNKTEIEEARNTIEKRINSEKVDNNKEV